MAQTWSDVKQAAHATGKVDVKKVAEYKRQMKSAVRMQRLADIRESYGLNQEEVATAMEVSQSRVSRIERGDVGRTEVSTLQNYVAALGGEIEIVARFGDERITIG